MGLYELSIIGLVVIFLLLLNKLDNKTNRRFIIIFIGILLFQFFTHALWLTVGLASWSYLTLGVNWIITLGRSLMVIVSMAIIDIYFPQFSEKIKFFSYIIVLTISGVLAEANSVASGIIQYHPKLLGTFSGITIINSVPVEALYYIPIFMILVISFTRYWELALDSPKATKLKRKKK